MPSVLFSGHMVDAPDRSPPRFPPERVPAVRRAIAAAVAAIDHDALAISGLASGGDLIFCEVWLATGRRLVGHLPRAEAAFLDESVRFAGDDWVEAYARVVNHPGASVLDPTPQMLEAENPHTLNNLRMLASACSEAPPLEAIFLWNGEGGDGPGGTGHLVSQVIEAGGAVTVLEP